jgi:ATP-binding cassette subfamily F protein 3
LVKLLLDPPNLLLMDEPTTHLDMPSIDALIQALEQYEGTLVFISHDVHFIRALAKTVLHIDAGRLTPYAGGYDYYLEKSRATDEREALVAANPVYGNGVAVKAEAAFSGSGRKSTEQTRAEAEARNALAKGRREREERLKSLEREIATLEGRQQSLSAELEEEATYQQPGRPMELNRELTAVTDRLARLTREWEGAAALAEARA